MKTDLEPPEPRAFAPSDPLASAWLKYNRGVAHFLALRDRARAHMQATSDDATIEQRRLDALTIGFYARLPEVDMEVRALVGDVAHGLRTALDHAAWAMATTRHRDVAFPIYDDADRFSATRPKLSQFHTEGVIQAFECLQPFHGRVGLSWIRDINNADKHQAVVVVRHRLEIGRLVVTDSETGEIRLDSATREQPGPIDVADGEPILRMEQSVPGSPRLKLAVDLRNSLALARVEGRSWPQDRLDLVLRQSMFDVEECLTLLQAFLDGDGR